MKKLKIEPVMDVLNRKAFFYELDNLLTNVQDERISLAMLDIDNFKTVKDTFGYLVVDEVILNLVGIVRKRSDNDMIFGQYGGGKFAILFKNHSIIKVVAICESIRETFGDKIIESKQDIPVTVSIGVATYTSKIKDSIDFIRTSDVALYKAKESGKNRIVIC